MLGWRVVQAFMRRFTGNMVGLLVVTVGALAVMVTVATGKFGLFGETAAPVSQMVAPKAVVAVMDTELQPIEIIDSYHGMIRPFERHTLAFEVPGLLESFGQNADGEPLDVGDRVKAGQVLAHLDERRLQAQLKESRARMEKAQFDLERYNTIRDQGLRAITEQDYQTAVTEATLAEAQNEIAIQNLEDAILQTRVDGVISKRMTHVGQSVNMHEMIFEILELDRVLLVVGVPESRIRDVNVGQRVHVNFIAYDAFGRPHLHAEGVVHQVGEAADEKLGLFEVEIVIDNPNDELKPGLVAEAQIVLDTIEGFRVPIEAAVMRGDRTILYSIDGEAKAQSYELGDRREQNGELILLDLPEEYRRVVVRGQHRLVDGREVEIYDTMQASGIAEPGTDSLPTTAVSSRTTSNIE